jgi:hypothetical protein
MKRPPLAALPAALALSGCLSIDAPGDFLLVGRSTDELKLIAADESKLWVREFADEDEGDLEFWAKALRTDLADNRGYTLIEERDVRGAGGLAGKEWLFEVSTRGEAHRYLVTLFVIEGLFENTIRVSEFVAARSRFDEYLDNVRRAVASVR